MPRVLKLVYTSFDMKPFAEDCDYTGQPFKWDSNGPRQIDPECVKFAL